MMRENDSSLEVAVASHIVKEVIRFPDRTLEGVLGSPAAYSSVSLDRLGAKAGLASKIGTDLQSLPKAPPLAGGEDVTTTEPRLR